MITTIDCPTCLAQDPQPDPIGTLTVESWSERQSKHSPGGWSCNVLFASCGHIEQNDKDLMQRVARDLPAEGDDNPWIP